MRDRMRLRWIVCLAAISLAFLPPIVVGSPFVNLDFEGATVDPTPPSTYGWTVDPALAFPWWNVRTNAFVLYNNFTLGSPAESLVGPEFPNGAGVSPLEGSYSVVLQFLGSLSQSGDVPTWARSITFLELWVPNGARVTLDGADIPLVSIGGGRLAGDVSAFAGQNALLTFTTTTGNDVFMFDDVSFSPIAVPEPSSLSTVAFGILALAVIRRKSS